MTMNESLLNDIRATINWAVQSQTNISAAYSVLETLVKDIEKKPARRRQRPAARMAQHPDSRVAIPRCNG